jgi:hypothetical protein
MIPMWFYLHGHSLLRDGHQVVDEVGRSDCRLRLRRPTRMNPQKSNSSYQETLDYIITTTLAFLLMMDNKWRANLHNVFLIRFNLRLPVESFTHVLTVVKVLFFSTASFWGTCQISTSISEASSLG